MKVLKVLARPDLPYGHVQGRQILKGRQIWVYIVETGNGPGNEYTLNPPFNWRVTLSTRFLTATRVYLCESLARIATEPIAS